MKAALAFNHATRAAARAHHISNCQAFRALASGDPTDNFDMQSLSVSLLWTECCVVRLLSRCHGKNSLLQPSFCNAAPAHDSAEVVKNVLAREHHSGNLSQFKRELM
jgi:hypothetical protein